MSNRITNGAAHVLMSARSSTAVTPSDTTALQFKRLWVGTTGDVAIKHDPDGAAVTYANVPGGSYLDVCGCRVMAATTASDIVAMDW